MIKFALMTESIGLAFTWHKTPQQDIGILFLILSIQIKF